MIIATTDTIPGKEIIAVKGLAKGSTVRSKHIGKDIGASFKTLIGGELNGYNEMLSEARQIAISRMIDDAVSMGATDIVGMRFSSVAVMAGAAEMMAYGTAVVTS